MPKTRYSNLYEITNLQLEVMRIVSTWVHEIKKPIPNQEIFKQMREKGTKEYTTKNAIGSLLRKGYLRRAVVTSNQTYYVMLRSV
jgi:predicted DNA-binding transcriptional regulator